MYLILPSNTGDFSTNTTSSYRVRLPRPLTLGGGGDWEVALAEIQYPISWNTVKETEGSIFVRYVHNGIPLRLRLRVQAGFYDTVKDLLMAIKYAIDREGDELPYKLYKVDFATLKLKKLQVNEPEKYKRWLVNKYTYEQIYDRPELIPEVGDGDGGGPLPDNLAVLEKNVAESDRILKNQRKKNILRKALKFEYAPRIKRITVRLNKKTIKGVTFDETLQFMLGFPRNTLLTKRHNTATYNVDISAGINSFFIYCNIVEPQFVGNALKPLLRTVPVAEGQLGTTVHKEFISPHYIGLLSREFDTIEIEVRNDFGDLIDFQFGKVIVKLHFRRKTLLNL